MRLVKSKPSSFMVTTQLSPMSAIQFSKGWNIEDYTNTDINLTHAQQEEDEIKNIANEQAKTAKKIALKRVDVRKTLASPEIKVANKATEIK